MKKVLVAFLSLVLVIASGTNVYASDSYLMENGATATSEFEYYVDSYFSVVVPERISIVDGYTFHADYMNILPTQQVNITVTNLVNGRLQMTNESGDTLGLMFNNAPNGDRVAEFTSDSLVSKLTIYGQCDDMPRAGFYTGTAEFVISLGEKGQ